MTRDEYRKGGPHDDVANNIRAQQNADAAPSAEEARAEARRALSNEGCQEDGCDESDPDKLNRQSPVMHSCSEFQSGAPRFEVMCDEHVTPVDERRHEQNQKKAQSTGIIQVLFTCGITESATREQEELDDRGHPMFPGHKPQPTIPAECRCGANISTVFYPEERS